MKITQQLILSNLQHLASKRGDFSCSRWAFSGGQLEPIDLERGCLLDNGRHSKEFKNPVSSSGYLGALPVELLHIIFIDLDIASLTALRRVDQRTRLAVDSQPEYNNIFTHAPNLLRAVLTFDVGGSVSCRQLHMVLCSRKCAACGRYGEFLFLLTFERACSVCLEVDIMFFALDSIQARVNFGLGRAEMARLTTLKTFLPVSSSQNSITQRERISLVSYASVRQAGVEVHGSAESMKVY